MKSFFGYPGGKSKAASIVFDKLKLQSSSLYIEPFSGAFSMGIYYKEKYKKNKIWINEYDTDLYCLWKACIEHTDDFCSKIEKTKVDHKMFYTLKEKLSKKRKFNNSDLLERALEKLIIHKISFSNLGEKAGGPVGGLAQKGLYKVDWRWKPDLICARIKKISSLLKEAKITNLSFEETLENLPDDSLIYADPPYVDGGPICYKCYFTDLQHAQLAGILRNIKSKWFVTYDNHSLIKHLYRDANIQPLNLQYSMTNVSKDNKPKTVKELLISNF